MNNVKQNILITGCSGYLGSNLCKLFYDAGYNVIGTSRSPNMHNKDTSVGIRFITLNPERDGDFYCVLNTLHEEGVYVDVVIHAGWPSFKRGKVSKMRKEDFVSYMTECMSSSFLYCIDTLRFFKMYNKGTLIGINSVSVVHEKSAGNTGAYTSSKSAFHGLLLSLSDEMKNTNIHIYSLVIPFMAGGMNKDIPEAFISIMKKNNEQIVTPAEVFSKIETILKEKPENTTQKVNY